MYHAVEPSRTVANAQEEADLGPGWSRVYIPQMYPKFKYHWKRNVIVKNPEEEAALGAGWADRPAVFAPYLGERKPRTQEQNALKWVDEWTVAGLTSEHR